MTGVLIRGETHRHTGHVKMKTEARGDAATRYRVPSKLAATRSWKRGKNTLPQNPPSGGTYPENTVISDPGLQNWERINFCCFRPPDVW